MEETEETKGRIPSIAMVRESSIPCASGIVKSVRSFGEFATISRNVAPSPNVGLEATVKVVVSSPSATL